MTAILSVVRNARRGLLACIGVVVGMAALAGPAMADRDWRKHDDRHHHYRPYQPHYYAPPPRVVVRPPPVYYAPPPVYYYPPAYYAPRPYHPPPRSGAYIYFGF